MKIQNLIGQVKMKLIDLTRGTEIVKTLSNLRKEQFYRTETLNDISNRRFDEITNMAKTSTEYYKKYDNYDNLKPLTKDEIRNHYHSFISKTYNKKIYPKGTGGSTGTPLVYMTTVESRSFLWAGILLSWETAGYKIGDKVAFIAGTSIIKSDFKHDVFYKLMNIDVYSTFTLNETKIKEYINKINKSKATIIYGYATALGIIANYIDKYKNIELPYLKGIVSTAEVLSDENRKLIENAFKVNVYNQYGCNEAGVSAYECEYKKMHIINTRCKYETDFQGNLLATDLINHGFIMMKYFTGDQLELSDEVNCKCKRNYPIIKNIKGRSYDIVIDKNNNMLHAAFFNILFRNNNTIKQFQVQFDKNNITVFLNADLTGSKESDYDKYLEAIKKHLDFDQYKIVINAPFLKSDNAKHRYVINKDL